MLNDQNWPFWANQSHFLAKFAIVCHFELLQCEMIQKSWRIQIICQCTPTPLQKQKILRFLQKWETVVVKDGKSCESGEIEPFQGQSEPDFGEKDGKTCKMTKIGYFGANLSHLFWQNSPLWGHFELLQCEMIWKKLKNLKQYGWCSTLPQEQNFLRFLQKWDALVVKDGKSCESGEIGHSKSIWASFWGKRWKNLQNDQNWPFWANLSHFFAKFAISIEILLRYLSFHQFWS